MFTLVVCVQYIVPTCFDWLLTIVIFDSLTYTFIQNALYIYAYTLISIPRSWYRYLNRRLIAWFDMNWSTTSIELLGDRAGRRLKVKGGVWLSTGSHAMFADWWGDQDTIFEIAKIELGTDQNPMKSHILIGWTSYFGVHQGTRVLTQSHCFTGEWTCLGVISWFYQKNMLQSTARYGFEGVHCGRVTKVTASVGLKVSLWKCIGKIPDANPAASILCEPAQSKCTWTVHKNHSVWIFTGNWPDTDDTTSIEHRAVTLTVRTAQCGHTVWGRKKHKCSFIFLLKK
jgi:hypothetical protein